MVLLDISIKQNKADVENMTTIVYTGNFVTFQLKYF